MTSVPLQSGAAVQGSLQSNTPEVAGLELARLRALAAWTRLSSWEYWPSWAVYLPLAPWLAYLAVRHGGITTCTACNPAIPLGGLVGESKWQILSLLPRESIVGTELLPAETPERRVVHLQDRMIARGWRWPIILKPDVGERGAGVRLIHSFAEAMTYFESVPQAVLAQEFHPGPYEAGVFYVRLPDQDRGQIFSITDKRFASVTGDGHSTLRSLIWRHPRYRCQASVFLNRIGDRASEVPAAGQVVCLGIAGNHCQGTMFLDGAGLATPQLLASFDRIARHTPGFYFGRFDVRYTDQARFMRGEDFRIVELNGLLSESTNIYDPCISFWQGQRTLRKQWELAYRIGGANRAAGASIPGWQGVLRSIREHAASKVSRMPSA